MGVNTYTHTHTHTLIKRTSVRLSVRKYDFNYILKLE
jgi:hypothetical protein